MSTSSTPAATPPKKAVAKPKAPAGPKTVDMVVEAISTIQDRKGASIQAIKTFILEKYPSVDPNRLRNSLKRAVQKGLDSGVIVRPKANEASGASLTGRLKVDKAKLAAQNKEKKPKAKAVKKDAAPKAKKPRVASKSPKKALSKAKKSPAKPKSKTLTKTKADKAKPAKKATKTTKAKTANAKEPKKLKAPKTPKTPAKAKAKAATKAKGKK